MIIYINHILEKHRLNAICDLLADDSLFVDGKLTAGSIAKNVKLNLQADSDHTEIKGALTLIENALLNHPIFKAAAIPKQFAKIMFNNYGEGMAYGAHVDEAFINHTRTDLSFTLFLSEPSSYDGGELVIQGVDGDEAIKLAKGTLVLYPSTSIHYITPVTRGKRLAAVGWVQSRVRSAEKRSVLFDLFQAQQLLSQQKDIKNDNSQTMLQLLKIKTNLLRLWAD